jgi:hypothetical protein
MAIKVKRTIQNSKVSTLLNVALYVYLFTFDFFLSAAGACPGCKEALFEPGKISQNLATARGYASSIALLLGVPAALLGTITLLVVRARRKSLHNADPHAD